MIFFYYGSGGCLRLVRRHHRLTCSVVCTMKDPRDCVLSWNGEGIQSDRIRALHLGLGLGLGD